MKGWKASWVAFLALCSCAWAQEAGSPDSCAAGSGDPSCAGADSQATPSADTQEALPRIAFLILVHNRDTLDGCIRLVEALYDPEHTFLVHFDQKMQPSEYEYEWRRLSYGRQKSMKMFSYHSLQWGSWIMLAPWFSGAQLLLNSRERQWDYFINLSGDSYPVLSPLALRRRLATLQGLNFVTSSSAVTGLRPTKWSEFDPEWHKRRAFPFPLVEGMDSEAHYGSQWMVLQRDFVAYVIAELDKKGSLTQRLADFFVNGSVEVNTGRNVMRVKPHIPDEIFFPTVLMKSRFNQTVPNYRVPGMDAIHYIRMDEHYPWVSHPQRYSSPNGGTGRAWGPYYLGVYDLGSIKRSGALFIRKVSDQVDANIFRLLPVEDHAHIPEIDWPGAGSRLPGSRDSAIDVTPRGPAGRIDENGCFAVAESIHCPPRHLVDPDVAREYRLPVNAGG